MDWSQVLTIIAANLGIFLWLRTESAADRRQMQTESAADRRDILHLIREIKDELKEHHGRLERIDADFKSHILEGRK